MTVRIIPNRPRRGLILLTPDKKISDFRSLGLRKHCLTASRRTRFQTIGHILIEEPYFLFIDNLTIAILVAIIYPPIEELFVSLQLLTREM
jgi:hypothetical protein